MTKKIGIFVLVLVFITGCSLPSIHPLYDENTTVTDSRLEGSWQSGPESQWTFKKVAGESYYKVAYTEGEATNTFDVHLVKLGKNFFLDFIPDELEPKSLTSFTMMHLVPAHTFAKLELSDDKMIIHPFDADFISEQIKNNRMRIKHEITANNDVLLTANTEDLQKFVLKYADKEEVFEDGEIWTKVR